jgi:hypothetical protein
MEKNMSTANTAERWSGKEEFRVARRSRYGILTGVELVDVVPNLNWESIADLLMRQAEKFSDRELLEGKTLGGLFVNGDTCEYGVILVHTDRMGEELTEANRPLDSDSINEWLLKACNIASRGTGDDVQFENAVVGVERILER